MAENTSSTAAPAGGPDLRLGDPALVALICGAGNSPAEAAARLAFWQAATAGHAAPDPELERALAQDILAARDAVEAEALLAARGPMLVRAASRLRAAGLTGAGPGDAAVESERLDHPWRRFFGVEVQHFRHRLNAGSMSAPVRREVFVMTDAVTVLPYDPRTDRVLVVEQIRAGALARGEARPWVVEAVAGRIDPGETPEDAARRETAEEAGLELQSLLPVAAYYPSPGAISEYIYSFLALVDLPEPGEALHGLAEEGEDIRAITMPYERAAALLAAGEFRNAPLILTLLWLARERDRLRQAAGAV